ncbi:ABC transporter domain-containing protein [Ditylenchus destructor]|uniref:ABC transporter domain-containing protein n=1 Tax=Ditylenchus destructor TaxID=166010 RepID=A0AAD4R1B4_9BILA|nr:ABC transporter domain-containing protein [Ditylenchus destructor]
MARNNILSNNTCTNHLETIRNASHGTVIHEHSTYAMIATVLAFILAPLFLGFAVWKWNSAWEKAIKRAQDWFNNSQTSIRNFFKKWRIVFPYVIPLNTKRTRITIAIFTLLMLAMRSLNLVIPLSNKWIMDALGSVQPDTCYKFIIISSVLTFLKNGILNKIEWLLWKDLHKHTKERIHVDVFTHIHRLPLKWHLERSSGEIYSMIERGVACLSHSFYNIFIQAIPEIIDISIALLYCIIQFNLSVAAFVMVTITIYLTVTVTLNNCRGKYGKEESELSDKFHEVSLDSLTNFETVKHYGAEKLEEGRFLDAYRKYREAEWKDDIFMQLIRFSEDTVTQLGTLFGSLAAAYLVVDPAHNYTVGDYVLFTTYIMELWWPMDKLSYSFRQMSKDLEKMEKIIEVLNTEPEIRDSPDAVELEPLAGSIEFQKVSFSYKPDKPILQDVSFRVEAGQTVAIVGPSGSGKTTITRLLFRLYDVTAGKITMNGHDIDKIKMESLRKRIGVVPQDCILFNQTVGFNIEYGKPGHGNLEDVAKAAKAAAIHEFITTQREGYETLVGERGLKLSGGEKQRVAIARATLKQPHYVVLDEATSALDTKTEREIQKNLLQLCHEKTCIIIAHRLSTIVHAHKIIVLNKGGSVAEQGSHEELLSMNGLYAEMWRIQLRSHIVETLNEKN